VSSGGTVDSKMAEGEGSGAGPSAPTAGAPIHHDAFVSYARRPTDQVFVDELCRELELRGKRVWVDRADIPPGADWLARITRGIEGASSLLFVLSPDSAASSVCRQELEIALQQNKRIIPILHRRVDVNELPPALAKLNWIPFTDEDDRSQALEKVLEAIETDLEWRDAHTRLGARASEWASAGHDKSFLLRGSDLRAAEDWYQGKDQHKESPTVQQVEYLMASRRAATGRQRTVLGGISLALVISIVLGVFALVQRNQAVHQSKVALSGELASESSAALGSNVLIGSLLSMEAYARAPTVQARSAMVGAIEQPLEAVFAPAVGEINAIAYDPIGHVLAVGGRNGAALWDTVTDTTVGRPFDSGQLVNAVAFSPDGSLLAVGQANGFTAVFTVSSRSLFRRLPGDGKAVTGVTFTPNGSMVAGVTGGGGVFLWNLSSGTSSNTTVGSNTGLLSVAVSPDGSLLAVGGAVTLSQGGSNGVVEVYPLTGSGQASRQFTDNGSAVQHVAFNQSGSVLAASDDNGNVFLLNPADEQQTGVIRVGNSVPVIAFNPSGTLIATGDSQGTVRLWNTTSLQQVGGSMADGSIVYGLAFAPDGASLASGGLDGNVVVWTSSGRTPLSKRITDQSGIQDLSVSSDGAYVATSNMDGSVDVWNLRTARHVDHLDESQDSLTSVEFVPGSTVLAVGLSDGDVVLYDVTTRKSIGQLRQSGSAVNLTAFSSQDGTLAVGHGNGVVSVWNIGSRRMIGSFRTKRGTTGGVTALAFSANGSELAMATESSGVYLFDPMSPRSPGIGVNVDETIFSLCFNPDGSVLAAGDANGNVELLDTSSHRMMGSLPGSGDTIYGIATSPDGRTLATVDSGGDIRFWDLGTRFQVGPTLSGGTGSPIFSLAFTSNGSVLATGDQAGDIVLWPSLLWSTDLDAFSHDLCPRLRQNLTAAQWNQYVSGQPYHATCSAFPAG